MEKYTLSVLVENSAGVLSRVVGLFTRRGFNIDSLSVGAMADDRFSRITIEVRGDMYMVEQISKQLSKILEVVKIKTLRESDVVKRGLVLVKIKTNAKNRSEVIEIANVFRANIIDIAPTTVTAEVTGSDQKIEAFLNMLETYGIEEIARTGMTALERGANTLKIDK